MRSGTGVVRVLSSSPFGYYPFLMPIPFNVQQFSPSHLFFNDLAPIISAQRHQATSTSKSAFCFVITYEQHVGAILKHNKSIGNIGRLAKEQEAFLDSLESTYSQKPDESEGYNVLQALNTYFYPRCYRE